MNLQNGCDSVEFGVCDKHHNNIGIFLIHYGTQGRHGRDHIVQ
jgi:hypothetical protein